MGCSLVTFGTFLFCFYSLEPSEVLQLDWIIKTSPKDPTRGDFTVVFFFFSTNTDYTSLSALILSHTFACTCSGKYTHEVCWKLLNIGKVTLCLTSTTVRKIDLLEGTLALPIILLRNVKFTSQIGGAQLSAPVNQLSIQLVNEGQSSSPPTTLHLSLGQTSAPPGSCKSTCSVFARLGSRQSVIAHRWAISSEQIGSNYLLRVRIIVKWLLTSKGRQSPPSGFLSTRADFTRTG